MTAGIVEVGTKNCARVRVCWIAVISRGTWARNFPARDRGLEPLRRRALAHALHQVPLPDTLAIVLLLARREPQHYSRAAARFVGRLALERPSTSAISKRPPLRCSPTPTPAPPSSSPLPTVGRALATATAAAAGCGRPAPPVRDAECGSGANAAAAAGTSTATWTARVARRRRRAGTARARA